VTIPKPPWRKRKEEYIAHVPTASASVRLVSAADKLYNARAILADFRKLGDEVWTRLPGGRRGRSGIIVRSFVLSARPQIPR
jgi:hypothetical protein